MEATSTQADSPASAELRVVPVRLAALVPWVRLKPAERLAPWARLELTELPAQPGLWAQRQGEMERLASDAPVLLRPCPDAAEVRAYR